MKAFIGIVVGFFQKHFVLGAYIAAVLILGPWQILHWSPYIFVPSIALGFVIWVIGLKGIQHMFQRHFDSVDTD